MWCNGRISEPGDGRAGVAATATRDSGTTKISGARVIKGALALALAPPRSGAGAGRGGADHVAATGAEDDEDKDENATDVNGKEETR
jgi:hypothetical protein